MNQLRSFWRSQRSSPKSPLPRRGGGAGPTGRPRQRAEPLVERGARPACDPRFARIDRTGVRANHLAGSVSSSSRDDPHPRPKRTRRPANAARIAKSRVLNRLRKEAEGSFDWRSVSEGGRHDEACPAPNGTFVGHVSRTAPFGHRLSTLFFLKCWTCRSVLSKAGRAVTSRAGCSLTAEITSRFHQPRARSGGVLHFLTHSSRPSGRTSPSKRNQNHRRRDRHGPSTSMEERPRLSALADAKGSAFYLLDGATGVLRRVSYPDFQVLRRRISSVRPVGCRNPPRG